MSVSSMSRLRNGSYSSTSSTSSADNSSHDHTFNHVPHLHAATHLTSWLHEGWAAIAHPHEEAATGTPHTAMLPMSRERIEMEVQHAPNIRGMLDCMPRRPGLDIGVNIKQKPGTWPMARDDNDMLLHRHLVHIRLRESAVAEEAVAPAL